jgi:hypothetical protein
LRRVSAERLSGRMGGASASRGFASRKSEQRIGVGVRQILKGSGNEILDPDVPPRSFRNTKN